MVIEPIPIVIDIRPYCGASRSWNTEILACKISQHLNQYIVLDLRQEGWDIVENGIEQVVKNIADELNIPYKNIKFRSSDKLCKSQVFEHELNTDYVDFFTRFFRVEDIKVPIANNYGLFCGRGTNERLYSFWKHKNWQYTNYGKSSLHVKSIENIDECDTDYVQFLCEHNEKWQDIKNIVPYTDLDHTIGPVHNMPECTQAKFWNKIYNDITIEIVCETSTSQGNCFITEKTLRPIVYGRLFMIVGSPKFEAHLKELGFDIFDDILDKTYDNESGYIRIDNVFNSLKKFLSTNFNFQNILPRLKANQERFKANQERFKVFQE